ncbi:signal transduction protein [Citrobacter freundii]|nr:signal transduction protein [Citrobacter freundii]
MAGLASDKMSFTMYFYGVRICTPPCSQLQKAIYSNEFIPFYQPITNKRNEIIGCEVLARWRNPESGLLNAFSFIKSIESAGLIDELTYHLMKDVFRNVELLNTHPEHDFLLSININLSMVMNPTFRTYLRQIHIQLQKMGVTPIFEITEREDIKNFPRAEDIFSQLINAGLRFMVDDFGTGYAGKKLFQVTRASFIKIDVRFFTDSFIENTVSLAYRAGAKVIAEGVETQEQISRIRRCGVHFIQGFLTGAPMPFEIFNHKLGKQRITQSI